MFWATGHYLATSCFPNCHPAGQTSTSAADSGNGALGFAFILLILWVWLGRKGAKK